MGDGIGSGITQTLCQVLELDKIHITDANTDIFNTFG